MEQIKLNNSTSEKYRNILCKNGKVPQRLFGKYFDQTIQY
jgi:hypothetical protein